MLMVNCTGLASGTPARSHLQAPCERLSRMVARMGVSMAVPHTSPSPGVGVAIAQGEASAGRTHRQEGGASRQINGAGYPLAAAH